MGNEVKFYTYTLINYFDVYRMLGEGWIVNNQCIEFDDIHIASDATPKEILTQLKLLRMLDTTDMRKLEVVDNGNMYEILTKKDHMPLFALMLNY